MVKAEEIDFIAERNSEIKYLQVATTILEERTRKREIGNLEKLKFNFVNKPDEMPVYGFDLNGALIHETFDSTIENLQKGIYIVRVGAKTIKVAL